MKPPLTKVQANELHALAKKINEREETIQALRGKIFETGSEAGTEIILQGQDLIKAKDTIAHGLWIDWLKAHCPRVSERTAQHYMAIARNPQRVALLKAGIPSRDLFGALEINGGDDDQQSGGKPKVYLPYMQTLYLFTRAVKYIGTHPLKECPEETRDELRKELEPIAAELWPDRFAVEVPV